MFRLPGLIGMEITLIFFFYYVLFLCMSNYYKKDALQKIKFCQRKIFPLKANRHNKTKKRKIIILITIISYQILHLSPPLFQILQYQPRQLHYIPLPFTPIPFSTSEINNDTKIGSFTSGTPGLSINIVLS